MLGAGKVDVLPWSESMGMMTETRQIQAQLLQLNQAGFLTINSQPRINSAPSSDPSVGWGGPNGWPPHKPKPHPLHPPHVCRLESAQSHTCEDAACMSPAASKSSLAVNSLFAADLEASGCLLLLL